MPIVLLYDNDSHRFTRPQYNTNIKCFCGSLLGVLCDSCEERVNISTKSTRDCGGMK